MCIINIIIDRFQYNGYGKGKRKIYRGELVLICARFTHYKVIPYSRKFSREPIFAVFAVDRRSTKIKSAK